jgi:hypothetical protein
MNACKPYPGKVSWLSVLLALALLCDLVAPAWKKISFFGSSGIASNERCGLDSFSEPSVAMAILRAEADRLFDTYVQQRDRDIPAKAVFAGRSVAESQEFGTGRHSNYDASSGVESEKRVVAPDTSIQSLEQLRREVQELKTDVDRKLLAIYSQRQSWPEFLNCYLEFLREAQQNSWAVEWAPCALVHSQSCGRTGEVVEALQHAILAHPDWKSARGLRTVLEQWGSANSPLVESPTQ